MLSLVTICHIQRYYIITDCLPHTVHFIPMTHLFCNWKSVPLNLPHFMSLLMSPPDFGMICSPILFRSPPKYQSTFPNYFT